MNSKLTIRAAMLPFLCVLFLAFLAFSLSNRKAHDTQLSAETENTNEIDSVLRQSSQNHGRPSSPIPEAIDAPKVSQNLVVVDIEKYNLPEDSVFRHILLKPVFEKSSVQGLKVILNSSDYESLEEFGFEKGDIITHIEGEVITNEDDSFDRVVKPYMKYETVLVTVNRFNTILELELEIR